MKLEINNLIKKGIGSYIALATTIKGKNLSESKAGQLFNSFVLKTDYSKADRDALIQHLVKVSNMSI